MKRINESLSHSALAGKDLSNQQFIKCDLSHSDLRGANLSKTSLYGSDLTGSRMADAIISLNCQTFKEVKFDKAQITHFLYLVSLSDCDPEQKAAIKEIIGLARLSVLDDLFGNK